MRRPAFGFDCDTQRAFRSDRLVALGRLTVDQITIYVGNRIRGLGAVAPVLFADQVKHPEVRHAFLFQTLRGEDLSRDHAFRVASAAPVYILLVFAEPYEGRHGVDMRRESHDRIAQAGINVDPVAGDGLSRHLKTGVRKVIAQPAPGRAFIPRDGFDLHQFACELEDIHKLTIAIWACPDVDDGPSKNEARL